MVQGRIAGCFVEEILCQLHGLLGDLSHTHVCDCSRRKQAIRLATTWRDLPFLPQRYPACGPVVDSDRKTAMLDCTDSPWFVGSLIPDFRHKVELCWSIQDSAENSLHAQPQRSRVAQHEPLSA